MGQVQKLEVLQRLQFGRREDRVQVVSEQVVGQTQFGYVFLCGGREVIKGLEGMIICLIMLTPTPEKALSGSDRTALFEKSSRLMAAFSIERSCQ